MHTHHGYSMDNVACPVTFSACMHSHVEIRVTISRKHDIYNIILYKTIAIKARTEVGEACGQISMTMSVEYDERGVGEACRPRTRAPRWTVGPRVGVNLLVMNELPLDATVCIVGQGRAQHSGGHASGRAGERGRGGGTVEELARAPMRRGHDEECGGTGGADDAREPAGGHASKDRGTGRCRAGTRRYNAELSTRAVKDLE